jgi:hypothetical protein
MALVSSSKRTVRWLFGRLMATVRLRHRSRASEPSPIPPTANGSEDFIRAEFVAGLERHLCNTSV